MAPVLPTILETKDTNPRVGITEKFTTWLLGILTLICVGSFTFMWRMSEDMAIMKDHDVQKSAAMDRMQNDINQLRTEVENSNITIQLLSDQIKNQRK